MFTHRRMADRTAGDSGIGAGCLSSTDHRAPYSITKPVACCCYLPRPTRRRSGRPGAFADWLGTTGRFYLFIFKDWRCGVDVAITDLTDPMEVNPKHILDITCA